MSSPPLTAIRVFEVVSQTGNFTRAAEQLNMTQAAVSYHIQQLERYVATPLFLRQARGVSLTAAGEKLAPLIHDMLAQLTQGLDHFRHDQHSSLTLATTQTFASIWLLPRLPAFQQLHPELNVSLKISHFNHKVDLARDNIDVVMRCGPADWPGTTSDFLMTQSFCPMCSPAYLAREPRPETPQDLLRHRLIAPSDNWWGNWFAAAGLPAATAIAHPGIDVETQILASTLALAGSGIALLSPHFFHRELSSGELISLFDITASSGRDYYLSRLHSQKPSAKITAFYNWIKAEANPA